MLGKEFEIAWSNPYAGQIFTLSRYNNNKTIAVFKKRTSDKIKVWNSEILWIFPINSLLQNRFDPNISNIFINWDINKFFW